MRGVDIYNLLCGIIFIISTFALLMSIDASIVYHLIRGQAMLKLYVIFNTLDVIFFDSSFSFSFSLLFSSFVFFFLSLLV